MDDGMLRVIERNFDEGISLRCEKPHFWVKGFTHMFSTRFGPVNNLFDLVQLSYHEYGGCVCLIYRLQL